MPPQVRVPVSRVALCKLFVLIYIKSICSVNITYLFTDVRWVHASMPSRQCGLATHHFTSASEDMRLDSKERAQFNGLANKLSSVHFFAELGTDA